MSDSNYTLPTPDETVVAFGVDGNGVPVVATFPSAADAVIVAMMAGVDIGNGDGDDTRIVTDPDGYDHEAHVGVYAVGRRVA